GRMIGRRFRGTRGWIPRWMNVVRAVSTEGFGRLRYYREIRRRLDADPQFGPYFEQRSAVLPQFYIDLVKKDLGPLWRWLPEGALYHDPSAYLKAERAKAPPLDFVGLPPVNGARLDGVKVRMPAAVAAV